jgi:GT2 family glycosyltransferase
MAIRAEVLQRVGLFAEPFFAYYEDADWSWRARRHGLAVVYQPGTSVSHRRSVTSVRTLGDRVRILGERNRLLALVRNAPAGVLSQQVWRRVVDGPDHGIRRGMVAHLPWALGTRAALARTARVGTEEVWERWAGADVTWDDGPCAPRATGGG